MKLRGVFLAILLVSPLGVATPSPVFAESLLFINEPQLTSDLGFFSDMRPPGSNPRQIQADDFRLDQPAMITRVQWWGRYFLQGQAGAITEEGTDRFRFELFGDDGGNPAASPLLRLDLGSASRTQVATSSNGVPLFEFVAVLPEPIFVPRSETYYLSLFNDSGLDEGPVFSLLWSTPLDFANQPRWFRSDPEQAWRRSGFNTAFAMYGTVIPEPSSLVMIALGLGAVGVVVTRRSSKRPVATDSQA